MATRDAKRLTLNISGEMWRELSWVAPFLQRSEHGFAIEAIREKLDRDRELAPPLPAGWHRPKTEE